LPWGGESSVQGGQFVEEPVAALFVAARFVVEPLVATLFVVAAFVVAAFVVAAFVVAAFVAVLADPLNGLFDSFESEHA